LETIRKIIDLLFGVNPELRQIIGVTLRMSFFSTLVSSLIGIPLGVLIGSNEFKGKKLLNRFLSTLMGLPPVVAGLIVFLFLSRSGPLGTLKLLYSVTAMVTAQVILITPIIRETAAGISLTPFKRMLFTIYEVRVQIVSTILVGFGRAIAEVGAVQMVGGNIQFKTRIMTTAIMMQTNMGNFEFAVALGIVLLMIAFLINSIVNRIQESTSK
jgi:tungstate transport system permease protein